MDTLFRVEMLGRLCLRQANREVTRFRTQKTAVLLAYLAFYKQRSHPREQLIELFWPESALEAGRTNLSVALHALRRQLESPGIPPGTLLIADRSQTHLNPLAFTTDIEAFDRLLQAAEAESVAEKRLELLHTALSLYQGDLLPGFYEDWVLYERNRLQESYLSALKQIVKGYAETRQYERAIEYALRMVQASPLRESACFNLMRLYTAVGRQEEALRQYDALEARLQQELQTQPSAPLREMAEQLRQKTLSQRTVREALSSERQPGETADTPRPLIPEWRRHSSPLPLQFTRFFGREEEIARLIELLEGDARLLTLTGPGGTGKTRLAIEVAQQTRERFPGGVRFVPLAEIDDPLRLAETLQDALELPPQLQTPALEQVIAYLGGLEGRCLLLLDNFEQITAGGAALVWTLLNRVPDLQCLVTSRRPLSLPGEKEFVTPSLPTPPLESAEASFTMPLTRLLTYPAIALFVDRAQAVRSEFQITPRNAEAIASLCRRLEGSPLAIELAAARARALTPGQMLERLADRFELLASRRVDKSDRHRSLWATIEWSFELLPPDIRCLFACLSVFRGGWSLEAAEVICAEPLALDYLGQLRAHSLLLVEESSTEIRFRMLETIREFATEKLQERGEEARARVRHQNWFLKLAEEAEKKLAGPEQGRWLQRLETEDDNLRMALQYAAEDSAGVGMEGSERADSSDVGLRISGALCQYWEICGHITEGRKLLARALYSPAARVHRAGAAKALNGAGILALRQGDYPEARANFEKALTINRELQNRLREALNLNNLGITANALADYDAATEFYLQGLTISRELGNRAAEALNLGNLGIVAFEQQRFLDAQPLYEQALTVYREMGDRFGESMTLYNLGNMYLAQLDYDQAHALFSQALRIDRELGTSYAAIHRIDGMASLAASRGQMERAVRLYGAVEALREEIGVPIPSNEREIHDQNVAEVRSAIGDNASFDALWQAGRTMTLEQAIAFAQSEAT